MPRKDENVVAQRTILKLVLLGDGGVGKTSLILRYVNDQFDPQCLHTVGVEFMKKNIDIDGKSYTLQIWDTAGQVFAIIFI